MTDYHSYKNHETHGSILVDSTRWFFKRRPYYVGDRISFRLRVERPQAAYPLIVTERFRDGKTERIVAKFVKPDQLIEGNPINGEGDAEYFLAYVHGSRNFTKITLVTASAIGRERNYQRNTDRILGAILSLLVGILLWFLGVIKIDPAWILRITQ